MKMFGKILSLRLSSENKKRFLQSIGIFLGMIF